MKAWLVENRKHWPVMGFTVGLVVLAVVMVAGSSGTAWCGPAESGPVCARNWLAAFGSVGAALLGGMALAIVLRGGTRQAATPSARPVVAAATPDHILGRLVEVGRDARDEVDTLAAAVDRLVGGSDASGDGVADFGALRRRWQGRDHAISEAADVARRADPATQRAAARLKRLGDDVAAALAPLAAAVDEVGRLRTRDPAEGAAEWRGHRQRLLYLKGALDELSPKFAAFADEFDPAGRSARAAGERRPADLRAVGT